MPAGTPRGCFCNLLMPLGLPSTITKKLLKIKELRPKSGLFLCHLHGSASTSSLLAMALLPQISQPSHW